METPGETPQPGVPGGIPLPRRGGPDTSGKRMVPWGGCPLFPLEGWEDRSSHSVDGTARLESVPEGAPLRVRLGVGDGTKVAFFPELFDPNDLQVEGIKRRWGETPPGLYYKAQLVALNPNTMAMASNGVLKTRTLYELEAQSDDEVDIGNQAWPIPKGPQVPQSILDEMEGREEDRENDPNGAYDPRFRDPRYASGPTGGHPPPGAPGNPFGPGGPQGPGVNPFSQGAPQGTTGNPFAGVGAPPPQGFGPAPSPGFAGAPQGTPFAPPAAGGFPGAFGVQPGGYPGATPPGMGPMQAPPPPGFEWVWHAFPQGGGTMVLREVPKPPSPPPPPTESLEDKITRWAMIGGVVFKAMEPVVAALKPAPAPPAQPSPLERIAEKMLTDRATQPAPAVDPKAIEASVRMEYEMRALRDQVTRLRETRPASEPKQPASEDFLKQFERYKELAEKLNPSARDEAQSTLGMIADLADTEGGKELLAKVGDGFARWLTAQPAPTYITAPAPVTAPAALPAPSAGPVASDAAVPTVAQVQPPPPDDGAPVLDPQGHVFCLNCGQVFALNGETAAAHAGHPFSRLTQAEVLPEGHA